MSNWPIPRPYTEFSTYGGFFGSNFVPGDANATSGFVGIGPHFGPTLPGDLQVNALWFPYQWGGRNGQSGVTITYPQRRTATGDFRLLLSKGGGSMANGWLVYASYMQEKALPSDKFPGGNDTYNHTTIGEFRVPPQYDNLIAGNESADANNYVYWNSTANNTSGNYTGPVQATIHTGFQAAHRWDAVPTTGAAAITSFNFTNTKSYQVPGITRIPEPGTLVHVNVGYWTGRGSLDAQMPETPGMYRLQNMWFDPASFTGPGDPSSQMPYGCSWSVDYQYYAPGLISTPNINFAWAGTATPTFSTTLRYFVRGSNPTVGHLANCNLMGGPTPV